MDTEFSRGRTMCTRLDEKHMIYQKELAILDRLIFDEVFVIERLTLSFYLPLIWLTEKFTAKIPKIKVYLE